MLSKVITNKADQNASLQISRRRQYDQERRKRIFDAKQRLFGLDMNKLERQITEEKKQQQDESDLDKRYEHQTQNQQNAVQFKSLEMENQQRIMDSDLNNYRCRLQRKDQRREYDLNDPNRIKNSEPTRVADDDKRLGISSAQIFSGEDVGIKERKQRQSQQQRAWLDQQVAERNEAEESRKQAERHLRDSLHSRDECLESMAKSESRMRKHLICSIREYNNNLAKVKKADKERAKKEKNEDDMAEIHNMLISDFLKDKKSIAKSHTDTNQMADHQNRETELKMMDKQWEQYAINMDRELLLKELELKNEQKSLRDEEIRFNSNLAKEQRAQNEVMKREAINVISQEFYNQFNKASR